MIPLTHQITIKSLLNLKAILTRVIILNWIPKILLNHEAQKQEFVTGRVSVLKCMITEVGSTVSSLIRYVTTEELEQALKEFGMQDERDIKDIISEVDADNVSKRLTIIENSIKFLSNLANHSSQCLN